MIFINFIKIQKLKKKKKLCVHWSSYCIIFSCVSPAHFSLHSRTRFAFFFCGTDRKNLLNQGPLTVLKKNQNQLGKNRYMQENIGFYCMTLFMEKKMYLGAWHVFFSFVFSTLSLHDIPLLHHAFFYHPTHSLFFP